MKGLILGSVLVLVMVWLVWRDQKKQRPSRSRKKVQGALQDFLPMDSFREDGTLEVEGKFRRILRVGDINLFALSMQDILRLRETFKQTLQRMENPFQISVQARRANYTDYLNYAKEVVQETINDVNNEAFSAFSEHLLEHLEQEAQKPRTDRENLLVMSVLPKVGGESEEVQLERLHNEERIMVEGLSDMGIRYELLRPHQVVEAIQNFWHRQRAITQRYRDALERGMHAPRVTGTDDIPEEERG
ncbi:hypothetical protein [Alicyclobacillus tolerans]|uniref:Uncharacterized protein n=1 Tax=Alicyclobacillus tolerans TaxID=90970 RepID=A0A1M6UB44_9BACL|nr:hypothetical protein [Alicyclobacillus montanus]SHK66390.1 hypothetical protein SAMN05443507_11926 [Alicyclobacillus montanus]